jgi:hypothetical protein
MRANKLPYSMLMLCQNDNVSLHALTSAVTAKKPNGCARTAWKNLEQLHKPKDGSTKYELVQKFNRLELRQENKTPDEWFAELESIRAHLLTDNSYDIPDADLISYIDYNAQPRMYQTLFTLVKRVLNHKVTISIEDLKRDKRQVYNQNTNRTFSHGKNKELVFKVEENFVLRRFLKEIVAFVGRKDTKLLTVGSLIKKRQLPFQLPIYFCR